MILEHGKRTLEKVHFFKGNPVLISEITSLFVRQMAALFLGYKTGFG
ncbi:hypothetical protein SPND122_02007 [Streptococcus pneumoniae]|nr:hypothetical protein SPND122_02007 [Streptococcus pneumoniae]